jgi:16S rRNA (uracil1498-N3)-methyltransferase
MTNRRPPERSAARTRTDRCFVVPPDAEKDGTIVLAGAEFHHCVRVSRARPGDLVRLLDGRGVTYEARLARVGVREAVFEVVSRKETAAVLPVDIAIGLIKAPRFDSAVEKCAELGVRSLIPFTSERCVRRIEGGGRGWTERIHRKVVAACKQAGRAAFLAVEEPVSLDELARRFSAYGAVYVGDAEGQASAPACAEKSEHGLLGIAGPEGGLAPEELDMLLSAGAVPVSLGAFRLRSETAAVALACRLLESARGPMERQRRPGPSLS